MSKFWVAVRLSEQCFA